MVAVVAILVFAALAIHAGATRHDPGSVPFPDDYILYLEHP